MSLVSYSCMCVWKEKKFIWTLGVRILDENYFISTSVDQMIKFWNTKGEITSPIKEIYTDIADVSNLEVNKRK